MTDREIYKEKVVIHHDHPDGHDHVAPGERATPKEEVHVHEHEPYRVDHVYYDHSNDRRHDWRTRGTVRSEILSFRRGVYGILNVLGILLVIEFFIKLFNLSPANPIVGLINLLTYPFIAPFGNFVTWASPYLMINWSILLALVVYSLIAYLLVALFESGIRSVYRRSS